MPIRARSILAGLLVAASGCSIALAQSPIGSPPAGSFGAGTAGINGIPIGPGAGTGLNNSVNDPSGFGNAAKMPPLPERIAVPTVPQAFPQSSVRSPAVTRVSPRALAALRGPRARAVARERARLLQRDLTTICRGC